MNIIKKQTIISLLIILVFVPLYPLAFIQPKKPEEPFKTPAQIMKEKAWFQLFLFTPITSLFARSRQLFSGAPWVERALLGGVRAPVIGVGLTTYLLSQRKSSLDPKPQSEQQNWWPRWQQRQNQQLQINTKERLEGWFNPQQVPPTKANWWQRWQHRQNEQLQETTKNRLKSWFKTTPHSTSIIRPSASENGK